MCAYGKYSASISLYQYQEPIQNICAFCLQTATVSYILNSTSHSMFFRYQKHKNKLQTKLVSNVYVMNRSGQICDLCAATVYAHVFLKVFLPLFSVSLLIYVFGCCAISVFFLQRCMSALRGAKCSKATLYWFSPYVYASPYPPHSLYWYVSARHAHRRQPCK